MKAAVVHVGCRSGDFAQRMAALESEIHGLAGGAFNVAAEPVLGADGHVLKGQPRHPVVEDEVVIYAGATVLGRITLGRGAVIGGNVWLTRSVAPGSNVTQASLVSDMPDCGLGA